MGAAIPLLIAAAPAIYDIFDGIFGNDGEAAARRAAEEERWRERNNRNAAEAYYKELGRNAPSREDLGRGETVTGDRLLGRSARADIRTDALGEEHQRNALVGLNEMAQGNLTAADRARMAASMREQGVFSRSQREAALRDAEARGMGGSTNELAGILSGQQVAADRMNQQHLGMQAIASQRAMQALQAQGGLATARRGQAWGENYGRASAIDEFNMNNVGYRRDVHQRNMNAYRNAAQQSFDNEMQWRQGAANARLGAANSAERSQAQYRNDYQRERDRSDAREASMWSTFGDLAQATYNSGGYSGGGGSTK